MIDFNNANEVFDIYTVYPTEEGKTTGYLLGRVLVQNGQLRILEDHDGMLKNMLHPGPVGPNISALNSLAHSAYTKVVGESAVREGKHIDLIPQGQVPTSEMPQPEAPAAAVEAPATEENAPQDYEEPKQFGMTTPPSVFDYLEPGMHTPQVIEIKEDQVFMNGHLMPREVVDRMLYKVRAGLATLRYRRPM